MADGEGTGQNHVDQVVDPKLSGDDALEAHVQSAKDALEVHPLITRIQHKFGAFNFIRNARNAKQAAIDDIPG
jgi:hypothetical protein